MSLQFESLEGRALFASTVSLMFSEFVTSEDAGSVMIPIQRSGDLSKPASVDLVAAEGTAKSPQDFTAGTTRVSFAANESVAFAQVSISNDNVTESLVETANLSLANPS